MNGFLAELYPHKVEEIAKAKLLMPASMLQEKIDAMPGPQSFEQALGAYNNGCSAQINTTSPVDSTLAVHIIAEVKPASPSLGKISSLVDAAQIVPTYESFASAISVLTDAHYFGGSFELLERVSRQTRLPVLCKDFVIDEYQVHRAMASGAAAVLLIVRMLDEERLFQLHELICSYAMTPVVEIQNEHDLNRAIVLGASTILINNRDLETLKISLETTRQLAPLVPPGMLVISASGITSANDLHSLRPFARRFLIGSALMLASSPAVFVSQLQTNSWSANLPCASQTGEISMDNRAGIPAADGDSSEIKEAQQSCTQ